MIKAILSNYLELFYSFESMSHLRKLMVFQWSLSDLKSQGQSILADVNVTAAIRFPITNTSSSLSKRTNHNYYHHYYYFYY